MAATQSSKRTTRSKTATKGKASKAASKPAKATQARASAKANEPVSGAHKARLERWQAARKANAVLPPQKRDESGRCTKDFLYRQFCDVLIATGEPMTTQAMRDFAHGAYGSKISFWHSRWAAMIQAGDTNGLPVPKASRDYSPTKRQAVANVKGDVWAKALAKSARKASA